MKDLFPEPKQFKLRAHRWTFIEKLVSRQSDVFFSSATSTYLARFLRLKKERLKPVYITTRSFNRYQPDKFYADASQAPWSVLDMFDDVEDKLNAFNLLFNDILDEHAPVKTVKIRGRMNPCVTFEIRELMKTRRNWNKTARRTKDPLAWSAYNNYCKEVKREIRLEERELVMEQIRNKKHNTNCIWKAIRKCIPNKSSNRTTYSKDD